VSGDSEVSVGPFQRPIVRNSSKIFSQHPTSSIPAGSRLRQTRADRPRQRIRCRQLAATQGLQNKPSQHEPIGKPPRKPGLFAQTLVCFGASEETRPQRHQEMHPYPRLIPIELEGCGSKRQGPTAKRDPTTPGPFSSPFRLAHHRSESSPDRASTSSSLPRRHSANVSSLGARPSCMDPRPTTRGSPERRRGKNSSAQTKKK
jgi:hypothetical protein